MYIVQVLSNICFSDQLPQPCLPGSKFSLVFSASKYDHCSNLLHGNLSGLEALSLHEKPLKMNFILCWVSAKLFSLPLVLQSGNCCPLKLSDAWKCILGLTSFKLLPKINLFHRMAFLKTRITLSVAETYYIPAYLFTQSVYSYDIALTSCHDG